MSIYGKKYFIRSKKRFTSALIFTMMMFFLILTYFTGIGSVISNANVTEEYVTFVVVEGDTLWSIAKEFNFYQEDLRAVVRKIERHNQLTSHMIYPNQIIEIPIGKP